MRMQLRKGKVERNVENRLVKVNSQVLHQSGVEYVIRHTNIIEIENRN
jgi:hypothetical protein